MPYRRNDYSFVVDSTFRPFSFQEMVQPLALYKDAYDKNEEAYQDLIDKTNTFAYLEQVAKDNPNSVAAQIYKGYADEMNRQFDDFSRNGLSMGNRRALVNLKRRYNGEIGRLDRARTSMEEERKRRQAMNAKDSSMLYATDNLDIDQFLDENTPNLYAISGNDLQALGTNLGKAISSREYSAGDAGSVLGDYYRDWVEKVGISQDSIAAFMQRPEVLQEVDNILKAQGASGNLSGNNLDRARQNVMNGIYSGIVYQESHKPVRDEDKMSAAQRASNALGWANHNIAKEKWDREKEEDDIRRSIMYHQNDDGTWELNSDYIGGNYEVDPNTGKLKKKSSAKTPEERAIEEMQEKELLDRMQKAQKMKDVRTIEEADKAGYVPVLSTVHPSHGSESGLNVEEARKQNKYDNIEGWRSGTQGRDVPNLYIDWTNAPLVEGSQGLMPDLIQWSRGSSLNPNNGDFSYDLGNAQTKILSDQEYDKLPEAVRISIEQNMKQLGYEDGTPYEVMQVTGKGGKTSYLTFVPKDNQILIGN